VRECIRSCIYVPISIQYMYVYTYTYTYTHTHIFTYKYCTDTGTYIHDLRHDLTFEPLFICPCSNTDTDINKSAAHEGGAASAQESPRDTHTSVGLPHTLL